MEQNLYPMNDQERELNYPLGDTLPGPGQTVEIAPGVLWLRMPLPFALNHINLWLVRDHWQGQDGWAIVDCGIHRQELQALWESVFAHSLQGLPVLRVLVTHMHPDHIGLADWLCARWQAPLFISATDYLVARLGVLGPTGFGGERAAEFFAAHGLGDPAAVAQIRERTHYFPSLVPAVPEQYCRLMDGMALQLGAHTWRCIVGYGHAPEHIALYCAELNLLIGGDMMLPRISTNVSVYEQEPEADALALFLESIDKFMALPADTLVLPSHGKPFTGMHRRIAQLHAHHHDRLQEVLEACAAKPCSAHDVLPVLFKRPMDLHQTTFAMGEAVAHLHALMFQGRLVRQKMVDGVYRFTT